MERREFLKKTVAMGLGAGVLFLPKGLKGAVEQAMAAQAANLPDLVALKGGSPEAMFDRGISEIGGMQRFVKQGKTVVIKPNMSWDTTPQEAANTSPALVARIIKHCLDAGAKRVYVMDHSIEYWERSEKNSGIGDALKSAGGVYAPAESEKYYQNVKLKGRTLKETDVHESILACDTLISVPVLKHHGGAGVSISEKNLMGCVWDRRYYHGSGLQACIADFLHVRKPDLNVIDAYRVITRNGPRGGAPSDVAQMNSQIVTTDIVAGDAAGARMLGREPRDIGHIRIASESGFGTMDLTKVKIKRITL